ncbi:HEPN domain-containing protein [Candidatus Woesearchaeota archaeon]|jgi:uncharacterized protein (UPF0332 family)|nr:HEPN domain-containing protein [Candidatus Woesearchaeota archaeon]
MTNNFLNKLKKENKLELVEYSNEIRDSYLDKSDSCYKSAKILLENNLLENSIGLSYYSMYDALLSLLFGVGIKCENHSGSILMLKLLFEENELFEIISNAKKERVDKQYYVMDEQDGMTREIAEELIINAENFILKVKVILKKIDSDYIKKIKKRFDKL